MKYKFWGWEGANVRAVSKEYPGISTPLDLYDALSKIWCAATCAPRMRQDWTPENKTLEQCSITAFLAQDIFGGKVYGVPLPGGNFHCYNVVGDCRFDLTSEQFGDKVLLYERSSEQFREVHFAKEEKRLRYEYLKKELYTIQAAAERIRKNKLIVIVRGIEPEKCAALSEALYAGGIRLMEITFDQKSRSGFCETTAAVAAMREKWEGKMCIGAGTVLTMEQLFLAKEAGAEYIVTPNTNPRIIREAKQLGMAVAAGAMTPTEIEEAYEAGADFVKVFPAGSLGCGYFKAVKSPLSHIPMLAVGGINEENIGDFMKVGAAGAGVGGNLVNKQWIDNGEFEKITELARKYVKNMEM